LSDIVDEIFDLFSRFGSGGYGEDLSLEQHMLQSALHAQAEGAPDAVVVAALLHDIGYFLQADRGADPQAAIDFQHELIGAAWLSRGFDARVTAPIALHVQAKRYLCAVAPGYFHQLSPASRLSLAVQGGVMSAAEAEAFTQEDAFDAALLLRRCDDRGKDAALGDQRLADYRGLLVAVVRA